MRRKFLLLFGFATALFSACTQDKMSRPDEEITGEVLFTLDTEGIVPQSKASVEVGVPKPEDLTVEILKLTNDGNVRLLRDITIKSKTNP